MGPKVGLSLQDIECSYREKYGTHCSSWRKKKKQKQTKSHPTLWLIWLYPMCLSLSCKIHLDLASAFSWPQLLVASFKIHTITAYPKLTQYLPFAKTTPSHWNAVTTFFSHVPWLIGTYSLILYSGNTLWEDFSDLSQTWLGTPSILPQYTVHILFS